MSYTDNGYTDDSDFYDFRQFDPTQSVWTGVSTQVLQANLAAAQTALFNFQMGARGETFSYTQGDGAKSVTMTRASLAGLNNLIRSLQLQLGLIQRGRRAIRVRF